MDYTKTDILCTKHRLWRKADLVQALIDRLLEEGYQFKEVVVGEPKYFMFADHYDELPSLFKKRDFYGIRIKMTLDDAILELNSNTDGVDNVHYTIFASKEDTYERIIADLEWMRQLIGPSNDQLAQFSEYLVNHRKVTYTVILILVAIALYFLGVHVFLLNLVGIIFSFSPFLVMYLLFIFLRRRR